MTGMAPDEWWVNMSRVNGIDATDPAQYTQGEIICAEQNEEIVRYLKAYIPGFENAYVDRVAPFMGIRETIRWAATARSTGVRTATTSRTAV